MTCIDTYRLDTNTDWERKQQRSGTVTRDLEFEQHMRWLENREKPTMNTGLKIPDLLQEFLIQYQFVSSIISFLL